MLNSPPPYTVCAHNLRVFTGQTLEIYFWVTQEAFCPPELAVNCFSENMFTGFEFLPEAGRTPCRKTVWVEDPWT